MRGRRIFLTHNSQKQSFEQAFDSRYPIAQRPDSIFQPVDTAIDAARRSQNQAAEPTEPNEQGRAHA